MVMMHQEWRLWGSNAVLPSDINISDGIQWRVQLISAQ